MNISDGYSISCYNTSDWISCIFLKSQGLETSTTGNISLAESWKKDLPGNMKQKLILLQMMRSSVIDAHWGHKIQFSFRNQFGKDKRILVLNVQRRSLTRAHLCTNSHGFPVFSWGSKTLLHANSNVCLNCFHILGTYYHLKLRFVP